jgi:sialic acid synthase SpsE
METIKIGNKTIGDGHPVYVIAEIGSNFNGSLSHAKKLIKLAKESGADAAKFQSFITEKLLSKNGFDKKIAFQSNWKKSVWQTYKDAELPRDWHEELNAYSKKIGIHFFSSPWDFEAVDLLTKLRVPVFKIGSGDITFHDLLKYIAKQNKPILLATGASTMQEITNAIKIIKKSGNNKIILLHSIVQYPSPISEANIRAIYTLKNKFQLNVGYSDHSPGSLVALASVALGASVIEKHFTSDPTMNGPDHPHSMNPSSFKQMVNQIRTLSGALGNGIKKPSIVENETRIIQRRSIWTTIDIKKGEKFTKNNISALRPAIGIPASEFKNILGKTAKKNFKQFQVLKFNDI